MSSSCSHWTLTERSKKCWLLLYPRWLLIQFNPCLKIAHLGTITGFVRKYGSPNVLQVYWRKLWYPLVTYYYGKTLWLARDSQLYFITCIIMFIIICIMMYIIMYTYTYIKIYIYMHINMYMQHVYDVYVCIWTQKHEWYHQSKRIIMISAILLVTRTTSSHGCYAFFVWRRLICKVMRRRARYMCWTPEVHASL